MAGESVSQNCSKKPDRQKDSLQGDDIDIALEIHDLLKSIIRSHIEWYDRSKQHLLEIHYTIKSNWFGSPS